MRRSLILFFAAACFVAANPAWAISPADVYALYEFEQTSGTTFTDSGPNAIDATFYRTLKYAELPAIDVSNATTAGPTGFGNALGLGTKSVGGVNHDVMVDIPASANLPGTGDTFAVSFWASTSSWTNTYGMLASYNLNGLEWSIGLHSSYDSLVAWTGDADPAGNSFAWQASCTGLTASTFAHFVVQFDGANGITNVYVNGTASTDAGNNNFWGNEDEGFTLGARVLDARGYTVPANSTALDEFAIIDGTVTSADVITLQTSGAADSSFDSRRLAYYALNETTGSTVADSSSNANDGTLVGYAATTMGLDDRGVATASRAGGVFGNCVEIASGETTFKENAQLDTSKITSLPGDGEAFTVCFWLKPDENMATLTSGWDTTGMIFNWSNATEGLGFSIGQHTQSDGAMIVRRTSGDYTSTGDEDTYGIYLGDKDDSDPTTGLNLDPTVFHHFAVTVDANGTITGMYVDGVYVASTYENGHGVTDEGTGVIGGRIKTGVLDTPLCAYLDDLAVLKGELTSEEIGRVMTLGVAAATVPEPSVVALLLGAFASLLATRRARS